MTDAKRTEPKRSEARAAARAVTVCRETSATPAEVWRVIADGWSYPAWVVGAARMRAVSPDWPQVGAELHHSVGGWPAMRNDNTRVVASEPARLIRLHANVRPFGEASVELTIHPHESGSRLEMREDVLSGPGRLMPHAARQAIIRLRNTEALLRLALLAERASAPRSDRAATEAEG